MDAVVVSRVGKASKRAVRRLREAGAVSPQRAVPLPDVGLKMGLGERWLVLRGVIKEGDKGRYWLDERAVRRVWGR